MEYENVILNIIAQKAGIEPSEIDYEHVLEDDLNVGQMEKIEILGDIQESLELKDLVEHQDEIETVGELVELVADKLE